jgi:hypothetical protein
MLEVVDTRILLLISATKVVTSTPQASEGRQEAVCRDMGCVALSTFVRSSCQDVKRNSAELYGGAVGKRLLVWRNGSYDEQRVSERSYEAG